MNKSGWERLKERAQQLRTNTPIKNGKPKKSVEQMNLEELLEAEIKYLAWYPRAKEADHPDLATKKHIYDNYITPRIAELKKNKEARSTIGK